MGVVRLSLGASASVVVELLPADVTGFLGSVKATGVGLVDKGSVSLFTLVKLRF